MYTGGWNVWGGWFLAGNQSNHQIFSNTPYHKNWNVGEIIWKLNRSAGFQHADVTKVVIIK